MDAPSVTATVSLLGTLAHPALLLLSHPGEVLLEDVIKPLGLTVTKAVTMLGVSRKTPSELVNQKSSLSPEMALRIAKATKTSPDSWIKMQAKLDLWNALQHEPKNVSEFPQRIAV